MAVGAAGRPPLQPLPATAAVEAAQVGTAGHPALQRPLAVMAADLRPMQWAAMGHMAVVRPFRALFLAGVCHQITHAWLQRGLAHSTLYTTRMLHANKSSTSYRTRPKTT